MQRTALDIGRRTVSGGVLYLDSNHDYYVVTSESGTTDDINTIAGGLGAGSDVFIEAASGHTLTFKDNVDNIQCVGAADFALNGDDVVRIRLNSDSSVYSLYVGAAV